MEKRGSVITRTFEQRGKKIIVQTDSIEYMEEQERRYNEDTSKEEDASQHSSSNR
jgi:hypothetical protein